MTLDENKNLTLTEAELACVKKANLQASPSNAALFLANYLKGGGLREGAEADHDAKFYTECILAYRRKDYEVK